jgi:hypothetical protein
MPYGVPTDPQTVETALHVLAACGGNSRQAAEQLANQGINVHERTLRNWPHQHADRYAEIRRTVAPLLEARAIATAYEVVDRAGEVEQILLEKIQAEADTMNAKDAAAAFRNISTSKGINLDKLLILQGRPTQVTEHRDTTELMRALSNLNPSLVIESTAEEDKTPQLASS